MKNNIRFDSSPFVASHGKEPRGRGSWAFALNGKRDIDDLVWAPPLDVAPFGPRLFSEAKKWIRDNAPVGTFLAEVQS